MSDRSRGTGRERAIDKRLSAEMTAHPLPTGFMPVVVRLVDPRRRKWRWHRDSDDAFDSLDPLIAAVASQ